MGGGPSGIRTWPRAERPREKLAQNGPAALSPAELLAILLRTGDGKSGQSALDLARGLWAHYREEWYAAVELTGVRAALPYQTPDALPLYEEIIVSGAWWDIVDGVAKHRLGLLLQEHPRPMRRAMLAWSRDDDMWKRRASILCQLKFKADTDLELLYACIEPSLSSKEFFLRKAIGWALRQYAWTDPREVQRYVRDHDAELSGLSRREALKNL